MASLVAAARAALAGAAQPPAQPCAVSACTQRNATRFNLSLAHHEPLAACGLLPVGWTRLVHRQARSVARVAQAEASDAVLIQDGKLFWLNPCTDKYHVFDGRENRLTLRSRPLEVVRLLQKLAREYTLPDAVFQLSYGDVPLDKRRQDAPAVPTVSIHGWTRTSVPFMRIPESPLFSAVQKEAARWAWSDKASKLIYADGHAWLSDMPGDPFRSGRKYIRVLAKQHSEIALLRVLPFANWSHFKYVLYLDGVGPSFRLQFLLQLGSVVFIPAMVIPSWPMSMIRPYVHYIPVHRNLSNLMSQLEWAKRHDAEAERIASASASFMTYTMHEQNRWCALHESIRAVADRQRGLSVLADRWCALCTDGDTDG